MIDRATTMRVCSFDLGTAHIRDLVLSNYAARAADGSFRYEEVSGERLYKAFVSHEIKKIAKGEHPVYGDFVNNYSYLIVTLSDIIEMKRIYDREKRYYASFPNYNELVAASDESFMLMVSGWFTVAALRNDDIGRAILGWKLASEGYEDDVTSPLTEAQVYKVQEQGEALLPQLLEGRWKKYAEEIDEAIKKHAYDKPDESTNADNERYEKAMKRAINTHLDHMRWVIEQYEEELEQADV